MNAIRMVSISRFSQTFQRQNHSARSAPSVSQLSAGMVFTINSPRRGIPAGMIQRHSRDPSCRVTWVTLKKSPSHAEKVKAARKMMAVINQASRERRRSAA